ncbi:MAG: DUF262 domain-containing HNH endonuclease family protein [Gammaproteobacteria bacterium]|nr:DUF262 domain-containing HNH endonuclease family protein [Gammaproteobacteria bacterium]
MKKIEGETKSIRGLLANARFSIDYYQREYLWGEKQLSELINDLCGKFLENYEEGCERKDVKQFDRYFLGSIILSDKGGEQYIIDGQQRLTTLTLLLIYVYQKIDSDEEKQSLAPLICSHAFGETSFNIDVKDRSKCMDALFSGKEFTDEDHSESVANILARYRDIEECFHKEISGKILPFFSDWLMQNVLLVVITASSDSDAYTIFETMNDRGLSLTPTDMLKGYLLANISDDRRNASSVIWGKHVAALKQVGKDEDADAIKSWLRSQYAQNIRKRERNAKPLDFDLIGTEFHRWVRDHEELLGLNDSAGYSRFIEEDFAFYARWYKRIRQMAKTRAKDSRAERIETIRYNAENNFTLQHTALLAALAPSDAGNDEEIKRKLRIVSSYIDILIARRIWNFKTTSYSAMQYNMFLLVQSIRRKSAAEIAKILISRLNDEEERFSLNQTFSLHGQNGPQVHRLLARLTVYIETCSGREYRYDEYAQRSGKNAYEVEHIWANHPERHKEEFGHASEFSEYRNRIGGLLLLPKNFNRSFGDLPYAEKRPKYYGQNLLAQSLCDEAYEKDSGFKDFRGESGLNFQPHPDFKKDDIDARQELYRSIAEKIWDPENLLREAEG